MNGILFDSESLRLAEHFMQDEMPEVRRKVNDLAMAIQDAVENWFCVEHSSVSDNSDGR